MIFPIGDIHGDYHTMVLLYNRIIDYIENGNDKHNTIVFLGDYIDRGPDSKKVLDFLMNIEDSENVKHKFIVGNHEEFMLACRNAPHDYRTMDLWQYHGGKDTFQSFNINVDQFYGGKVDKYIDWMDNLPVIYYTDGYVFVHAAINPFKTVEFQNRDVCLWEFNNKRSYKDYPKIVVHGHATRKAGPIVDIENKRIWMDTGMNLFHRGVTVCLPNKYNGEIDFERIEVTR